METPPISLCQLSFPDTTFERDIELALETGVGGLGIAEPKVIRGEEEGLLASMTARHLRASLAVPATWTILPPLGGTFPVDPVDPAQRVEEMVLSIRSLARLGVPSVMICTGPAGDRSQSDARKVIVEAIQVLAAVAREQGTSLSIEPMREDFRPIRTMVCSLSETLGLLDEVGDDTVGIVFDSWHMWDSEGLAETLEDAIPRFHAVQIADYREPTRGPLDRVPAGQGISDVPRILAMLRAAGYSGWYDLEVFSDDGRYGSSYPDSFWNLDPLLFARKQVDGFLECWRASEETGG
jgi:sugar phosphate isomerase/epimerase